MKNFENFVDRKHRKAIRELGIINDVLKINGLKTEKFLEDKFDPYIYVHAPSQDELPFGGIRIYKVGNIIAYRAQNESKTEPYGKAFDIDVEGFFDDLLEDSEDEGNEGEMGEKLSTAIVDDIKFFFKKNAEAYDPKSDIERSVKPIFTPPVSTADNYYRANGPWPN